MATPAYRARLGGAAEPTLNGRNSDWDMEPLSHDHALVVALTEAAATAGALALDYFRPRRKDVGGRFIAKTTARRSRRPIWPSIAFSNSACGSFCRRPVGCRRNSADVPAQREGEQVFVVDPIDGTRAFATGNPIWAVSIALVARHRPIVGIVHAPALAETYVAVQGAGARLNGAAIAVSRRRIIDAETTVGGPFGFAQRLRSAGLAFDLRPKIPSPPFASPKLRRALSTPRSLPLMRMIGTLPRAI